MDSEVKTRWLDALRSGKYKKGEEWLCNGDKYCCLGVLAEIEGILESREVDSYLYDNPKVEYFVQGEFRHTALLPIEVAEKYGLNKKTGIKNICDEEYNVQELLANINDKTYTFDEVIEYIEKNL